MFAGYRTYIAASLVATFGFLAQYDWVTFINNHEVGAGALVAAAIMAGVRGAVSVFPFGAKQ